MQITVTKHAKPRLKERAGIKGCSANRIAERAFEQGITREEATGDLYKYLTWLHCYHEEYMDLRLFNYKVYIFSSGGSLITVEDLPREYKKAFEKARENKRAAPVEQSETASKEKRRNTHIYLLGDGQRVKIGISRTPQDRIEHIKRAAGVTSFSGVFISPLCSNGTQIEACIKKRFSGFNLSGEWFSVSFEDAMECLRAYALEAPVEEISDGEIATRLFNVLHNNPAWHTNQIKGDRKMSGLQLVKSENFGAIQCDFYQDGSEYYMTREQIGQALEYADPQDAIRVLHGRNKERLDKYSVQVKLTATDEKSYDTTVYTRKGVMEICRWSRQPKADEFMDFVWNTMDDLYTEKAQKVMSPAELALLQAQTIVDIERKQNEQQAALEGVTKRLDTIGDILSLNPNDWRRECLAMLSKIAYSLGDIKHMQELQRDVYQLMDDRFGVRLNVRLTNMKRVAAENGMCESRRDKLNYLDVIAEDKKLIEAYVMIVKEMAIKHGVDKVA